MTTRSILGGIAALVTLSVALAQDGASGVKPGDRVSYSYREAPINARGYNSIEDFKGKPVLLEFWGMNCPPCIEQAVPGAVKLAKEYGDSIGIIFCESQGHTVDQMERFAFDRAWFGTNAMWTTERAAESGMGGLPNYILLDSNGVVLSKGNPLDDKSKIEKLIDAELKNANRIPKGTPKELEKAWKEFNAGKWAKGIELARAIGEAGGDGAAAAEELSFDFEARVGARVTRIERMLEQGSIAQATKLLGEIESSARGVTAVDERLTKVRETLASDAVKKEAAAEAALLSILEKCYEDGLDEKSSKRLAKVAETHAGTKAAERAQRLSRL